MEILNRIKDKPVQDLDCLVVMIVTIMGGEIVMDLLMQYIPVIEHETKNTDCIRVVSVDGRGRVGGNIRPNSRIFVSGK